jgi:hypothetical protein
MYHQIDLPHNDKWCYRMGPSADDKKYALDTRPFKDVVLADKVFNHFDESPISQHLQIKDVCIYKPGDLNKIGKEGKTSWDSFSYALMMGHNVWMHIEAVQRANREYDSGTWPNMLWNQGTKGRTGDHAKFRDIVDAIFATSDKQESLDIIEHYSRYWMDIIGTRGFKGDKTMNAHSQFNSLFEFVEPEAEETERDEKMAEDAAEDRLEQLARIERGGD